MESEKVKEIKKALEACCKKNRGITILRGGEIQVIPYADILTYINELESENERLKQSAKNLVFVNEKVIESNQQLKYRIAELEKQMCRNEDLHTATEKLNDTIILKQFAERLKDKYGKSCSEYYPLLLELTGEQLDETLKEFVGVEE